MELKLLSSEFEYLGDLDVFTSLIWTDRFYRAGDFEITARPSAELISTLSGVKYLRLKESDHTMILEDINIKTDVEDGNALFVTGPSIESILIRRIVWEPTILVGNFQSEIVRLLDENIINPTDTTREIPNFEYVLSTDSEITSLTIDTQFHGETLYQAIAELCYSKNVGFKITLTEEYNFRFELYAGTDRSYAQEDNPFTVFSPDFDNLIDANYTETSKYIRTVALVAGEEGVGNIRVKVIVTAPGGSGSGLDRRELYFEPNVRRQTDSGPLTEEEYLQQLEASGTEELTNWIFLKTFDGAVEADLYAYGHDYFMGDILQIADGYNNASGSRVVEMIFSQNKNGIRSYPTFSSVDL